MKNGSDRKAYAPFMDEPKKAAKPKPKSKSASGFNWGKLLTIVAVIVAAVAAAAARKKAISDNGLNYIANLEVGRNNLVLDSNGNIIEVKPSDNKTIGYGYDIGQDSLSKKIKTATNLSNDTALDYLKKVADQFAKLLPSEGINISLSQSQLDALVALRYNVGPLGKIPNIFNDINNKASYDTFQNDLFGYYEGIVKKYPPKARYLDGWKNRAKSILNVYFYGDYGSMP